MLLGYSSMATGADASNRLSRPNFILILSDDQGWNNTGVEMIPARSDTNSDYYLTPNLNRLAASGMTFSQAYSPHPVCSPSRHSIQFGLTPARLKKTTNQGARFPEPFRVKSIAQRLKSIDRSYKAAHFGKWHMWRHPADLGYDASDGRTGNQTGRQRTTDQTKFWPHEDPKRSVSITDESIQFIRHQAVAGHPFFLQISHYAIHLSAEAKPETLEKHKRRAPGKTHTAYWYAAMIEDLDHSVGRILDLLEELNLSETTYLIFTSDNGGTARQYPLMNKPLRGGKGSYYEGGIRVPFFAVGPGIQPGSYSSVPVVGYDLLPTFLDLCESPVSELDSIDGGSLKSVLLNNGNGKVTRFRDGLFFYRQLDAVLIDQGYKLRQSNRDGQLELYHLESDLSESKDLSATDPLRAEQFQKRLLDWVHAIDATTPSPRSPRGKRKAQ